MTGKPPEPFRKMHLSEALSVFTTCFRCDWWPSLPLEFSALQKVLPSLIVYGDGCCIKMEVVCVIDCERGSVGCTTSDMAKGNTYVWHVTNQWERVTHSPPWQKQPKE